MPHPTTLCLEPPPAASIFSNADHPPSCSCKSSRTCTDPSITLPFRPRKSSSPSRRSRERSACTWSIWPLRIHKSWPPTTRTLWSRVCSGNGTRNNCSTVTIRGMCSSWIWPVFWWVWQFEGKVSANRLNNIYLLFQGRNLTNISIHPILFLESPIVEISDLDKLLLVSNYTKCILCNTESEEFKQVRECVHNRLIDFFNLNI